MSTQNPMVRITSQSFTGPHKAEVVTMDDIYPMFTVANPISQEALEVKLTTLLAQAAASGLDVEISKHRDPAKGMGGYIPHIITRPVYKAVRAKMTEAAAYDANLKKHGAAASPVPALEPLRRDE
jgi:hypothetical protein